MLEPVIHGRRLAAMAACAAALLMNAAAPAADPAHDIWLVSSRAAPICNPPDDAAALLTYWQLGADGCWQAASREAFVVSADVATPVLTFVHGNETSHQEAVREGMAGYAYLAAQAAGRPLRYVVWSWPSERVSRGPLNDAAPKGRALRSPSLLPGKPAGATAGRRPRGNRRLQLWSADQRRALHLLAGGSAGGRVLSHPRTTPHASYRAMLVAGGLSHDDLVPGHRYGLATSQLESLVVTRNSEDPALRWYHLMERGEQAIGFLGPACPSWLATGVSVVDVNARRRTQSRLACLCPLFVRSRPLELAGFCRRSHGGNGLGREVAAACLLATRFHWLAYPARACPFWATRCSRTAFWLGIHPAGCSGPRPFVPLPHCRYNRAFVAHARDFAEVGQTV